MAQLPLNANTTTEQIPEGQRWVTLVMPVDRDGNIASGGGGGGGDASAANQTTQITEAQTSNTRIGHLTETAPGTDTASSGLNGRLQRLAQRLTSLIGLLPSSIGQKNSAGSLSTVLASDATLPAFAAIPTFKIDQTTPGTTNLVAVSNTGFNALQGGAGNSTSNPFYVTPAAGASFAVTQSGTWNLTNISGTISLPTGAATSAKQPALGAAGTPSADVISIQGVSGGTVIPANVSQLNGTTIALNTGTRSAGTQRVTIATDDLVPVTPQDSSSSSGSITAADAASSTAYSSATNQPLITGTATAGSSVAASLSAKGTVRFLVTGTFSATLRFETSCDGGTTWTAAAFITPDYALNPFSVTTPGVYLVMTAGATNVRARCTAYTSGTATVLIQSSVFTPGLVTASEATKQISSVTSTVSSSGDNLLIAAVPNQRIVVAAFICQNESNTTTTMILRAGTTAFFRYYAFQGNGITMVFSLGREYRLPVNTALNLNLSGANTCGYTIFYWME